MLTNALALLYYASTTNVINAPIEIIDGIFSAEVGLQCDASENNFMIVADINNNLLHVGIREKNKVTIYSEGNSTTPKELSAWSKK